MNTVNFELEIQKIQENIKELKSLKKSKRIEANVADKIQKFGEALIDLFETKMKRKK